MWLLDKSNYYYLTFFIYNEFCADFSVIIIWKCICKITITNKRPTIWMWLNGRFGRPAPSKLFASLSLVITPAFVTTRHCTLSRWVTVFNRVCFELIRNCSSQILQLFSWPPGGGTNATVNLTLNCATLIVRSSRHGKSYCVSAQSKEILYEKLFTGLLNHISKEILWVHSDLNWIWGLYRCFRWSFCSFVGGMQRMRLFLISVRDGMLV